MQNQELGMLGYRYGGSQTSDGAKSIYKDNIGG